MMRAWWIIRVGGKLTITMFGWWSESAVGPYWTVAEALKMIEKWR